MILKAGEREVELTFKAIRMEQLGDKLGGDTQYKLQEASYDNSVKILALLIKQFSTEFINVKDADETKGIYAFIDALMEESTLTEIYKQIFDGINEKGFFTPPLLAGELPFNMKQLGDGMSKEMMSVVAQSQIGASLSAATEK